MPRIVSFSILLAILLVVGIFFYKVMANFFLPMFLALLLVVIFQPVHHWFVEKCRGRNRLAAGLTTAAIVLIVLLPFLLVLSQAAYEGAAVYQVIQRAEPRPGVRVPALKDHPSLADAVVDVDALALLLVEQARRWEIEVSVEDLAETIRGKVEQWLGPIALRSVRFTANLLLGLGVMIVSLYYFLVDGPWMIRKIMRLSPLDDRYEEQLVEEFTQISRAVVLATLLSALAQGLLAGVGFYFAGAAAVFLLTVLAMLFAMIPFVGSTLIWAPTCLWLYFVNQRPIAAVLLAVYCAGIVSMADNVIKPLVLHGRSNLHPLLALLSVIGGVQALGPIGIFVGPMVVVFLHAVLNMLHGELEEMGRSPAAAKPDMPGDA